MAEYAQGQYCLPSIQSNSHSIEYPYLTIYFFSIPLKAPETIYRNQGFFSDPFFKNIDLERPVNGSCLAFECNIDTKTIFITWTISDKMNWIWNSWFSFFVRQKWIYLSNSFEIKKSTTEFLLWMADRQMLLIAIQ